MMFLCSIAFEPWQGEKGFTRNWIWEVEPSTRRVKVKKEEADQIKKIVEDEQYQPIFGNAKFDVLAIERACGINPYQVLQRSRDIVIESHLLNSGESHGVKDLAMKHCDMDVEDVKALQAVVEAATAEARNINTRMEKMGLEKPFRLANAECFAYAKKSPDGGWWICDTWLPAALNKWKKFVRHNNPDLYRKLTNKTPHRDYDPKAVEVYCDSDSIRTLLVDTVLYPEIRKNPVLLDLHDNTQSRLLEVVYRMESFGLPTNQTAVQEQIEHFTQKEQDQYQKCIEIAEIADLNPGSNEQLKDLFYNVWQLPVTKWTKPEKETTPPAPSTDIDAQCHIIQGTPLGSKPNEFCRNLILGKKSGTCVNYLKGYRSAAKPYRMSYGVGEWWRIHPSFNITGTNTIRFSSSNPNAQNIGKGKIAKPEDIAKLIKEIIEGENISLRKVFGPMPGREWYTADYKQLQLAIFAFITQDPSMIGAILAGYDFHDFMTRKIYNIPADQTPTDGQRTVGKNIDFGYIFGAGDAKIDTVSGIKGLSQELKRMFPSASDFIKQTIQEVKQFGCVSVGGYPLRVPQDKAYAGVNYKVQGYEGLIVKQAMVACHDYLMRETSGHGQIVLNVHDEIIFDFPEGMGEDHVWNLRDLMVGAGATHKMRLDAEFKYTTTNWSDMVKVEFDQAA